MEMLKSMLVAASGMRAQAERMRVIAENLANASSTAETKEQDPYRRQVPVFSAELDREIGAETVHVSGVVQDETPFREEYNPSHPAADARGYVRLPNVDTLVEMMDMRDAARAYEANLNMIDAARTMTSRALDLLRR